MSYEDGWAAFNLEMPDRVPRTEYSAQRHWELINKVMGTSVSAESSQEEQQKATNLFMSPKGWNYDLCWNVLVYTNHLGKFRTDMGHAEYDARGGDFRMMAESWYKDPEDVLAFRPEEHLPQYSHSELIKGFEKHYNLSRTNCPEAISKSGIYITLVSGLLEILGWDNLLMACGIDIDGFVKVADSYAKWCQQFFNAMADADIPVFMVHDDIAWTSDPFVAPEWCRQFIFPHYKKFFAPLHEAGKKILYMSDRNYSMFVDDVAACGINGFVIEPTTDMAYIAEKYGKTYAFVGNADTRILLTGTKEVIRAEVQRCMDIGKKCPGFFMTVGNYIPANTPVENVIYYNKV